MSKFIRFFFILCLIIHPSVFFFYNLKQHIDIRKFFWGIIYSIIPGEKPFNQVKKLVYHNGIKIITMYSLILDL